MSLMIKLMVFYKIGHAAADSVENILIISLLPAFIGFEIGLQIRIAGAYGSGQFPFRGVAVLADDLSNGSRIKLDKSYPGLPGYRPQPLGYYGQPDILSDLRKVVFLDNDDLRLFLGNKAADDSLDMAKHDFERSVLPDGFDPVVGQFAVDESGIAHVPGSGVNRQYGVISVWHIFSGDKRIMLSEIS